MKKPVVLCIMDGYGKNDSDYGNAIAMAKKPNLDRLMAQYPMTYIGASGVFLTGKWATLKLGIQISVPAE